MLLFGWTFAAYAVYGLWLVVLKIGQKRYEPWRNSIMKRWGNGVATIMSIEIIVEGEPPSPPFLVVSNHLSYMDIPIYSSVIKTTFVSKKEVRHWPLIGFMAHTLGIIFIDRKRKRDVTRVNREISEQLNRYQGVVLFPEGMTSPGIEVLRFRPPLLEHAASEKMRVSYSALSYQTGEDDLAAYKSVCWWGDTPLHTHLFRLAKNKRILAKIRFGDESIINGDRKVLAETLHSKVSELFEPVTKITDEEFMPPEF